MNQSDTRNYILAYNQLLKECDTVYHTAAANSGLSDCAFWILYTVQDSEHSCTQSEICDGASMPRQTVNSALKKLEKDGYLTLQRIEGKMGKYIHLTERGHTFVQKHIVPVMAAEERACALFSDKEKETFLKIFRVLVDRLKKEITQVSSEETQHGKE